jgi:hypothetical protein
MFSRNGKGARMKAKRLPAYDIEHNQCERCGCRLYRWVDDVYFALVNVASVKDDEDEFLEVCSAPVKTVCADCGAELNKDENDCLVFDEIKDPEYRKQRKLKAKGESMMKKQDLEPSFPSKSSIAKAEKAIEKGVNQAFLSLGGKNAAEDAQAVFYALINVTLDTVNKTAKAIKKMSGKRMWYGPEYFYLTAIQERMTRNARKEK